MDGARARYLLCVAVATSLGLAVVATATRAADPPPSDSQPSAEPAGRGVLDAISRALDKALWERSQERAGREKDAPQFDAPQFEATHEQVKLIKIPAAEQPEQPRRLQAFCLSSEDNLLAAVQGSVGEIVVLDPDGEQLKVIPLPVQPDAINVAPNGQILVGGEGQVLFLDSEANVLLQRDAPQVAAVLENKEELREQVIAQMKSSVDSLSQQLDAMRAQVERLLTAGASDDTRQELALLDKQVERLAAIDKSERTAEQKRGLRLRRRLAGLIRQGLESQLSERRLAQLAAYRKQIEEYERYASDFELTDEAIERTLQQSLRRKARISSIGAAGDDVFIATGARQGYGFAVWRLNRELQEPQEIITGLRGCCGQMDVQANEHGLFVAENARHRVCHYDRNGQLLGSWGQRDRKSVQGFGGCCNPMNVAFGADNSVYTAESSSGRIKRYDPTGTLRELIGGVDLVPGCKNVSIAVSRDGDHVYMLDITRDHIVVMARKGVAEEEMVAEVP